LERGTPPLPPSSVTLPAAKVVSVQLHQKSRIPP
jgi:hypothetical protein